MNKKLIKIIVFVIAIAIAVGGIILFITRDRILSQSKKNAVNIDVALFSKRYDGVKFAYSLSDEEFEHFLKLIDEGKTVVQKRPTHWDSFVRDFEIEIIVRYIDDSKDELLVREDSVLRLVDSYGFLRAPRLVCLENSEIYDWASSFFPTYHEPCSKNEVVDYFLENQDKFNDLLHFFENQEWTSVYISEIYGIRIDDEKADEAQKAKLEKGINGWDIYDLFSSISFYQSQDELYCEFDYKNGVSQGICIDRLKNKGVIYKEHIIDDWYYYEYLQI